MSQPTCKSPEKLQAWHRRHQRLAACQVRKGVALLAAIIAGSAVSGCESPLKQPSSTIKLNKVSLASSAGAPGPVTTLPIPTPTPTPSRSPSPVPSGVGIIAGDNYSNYPDTVALQQMLNARTKYEFGTIGQNLVSIDSTVTYNGGNTMMYSFPGGSASSPQITAAVPRTGDAWLHFKLRWMPGFTTTGEYNGIVTAANPQGLNYAKAYKFFFFAFDDYDGRSGVELTNTNTYTSYFSYTVRNGPNIATFSTPTWSGVKTEWTDGAWYDYYFHYQRTSAVTGRTRFWMAKDGQPPQLIQSAVQSTPVPAQYPVPDITKLLMGRNFNQKRLPNQDLYLWYAYWEVYDGNVNPNPFGID